MLLVKVRNAVELFWDTLDGEERQVVLYALAWLVVSVVLSLRRLQRESFKREILGDVLAAQATLEVISHGD